MEKKYLDLTELIKSNLGQNTDEKFLKLFEMCKKVKERGFLTKEEFVKIGMWKSPRPKNLYLSNPEEEIISISKKILLSNSEKEKMALLNTLKGVSIPVASAILTVINPENYGVIDIRDWQLLHLYGEVNSKPKGQGFNLDDWLIFLEIIRKYAKELEISVRDVEITLYFHHKDIQEGNLYNHSV